MIKIVLSLCIASLLIVSSSQALVGGFKKIEYANDKIAELANWVTDKLNNETETGEVHNLIDTQDHYQQLVNGLIYNFTINFQLSLTEQEKETFSWKKKNCDVSIYEQSWTQTRELRSIDCNTFGVGIPLSITETTTTNDETTTTSTRRSVGSIMGAVGAYKDKPIDATSIEIAQWSINNNLSAFTGLDGFKHKYKSMSNLQTKVVAGKLYKFSVDIEIANQADAKCNVIVFVQLLTGSRSFHQDPSCIVVYREKAAHLMSNEEDGLLGGSQELATMTNEMKQAIQWSLTQLSPYTAVQGDHVVNSVIEMNKKTVSGVIYEFELNIDAGNTSEATCTISVYNQPWTKTQVFHEVPSCRVYPKRIQQQQQQNNNNRVYSSSGTIVGAPVEAPITQSDMKIVNWATNQLSAHTNANGVHTLMKVTKFTTQVVAGKKYNFVAHLMVSNNEDNTFKFYSCEVSVYERAWENVRSFSTTPNCSENNGIVVVNL